MATPSFCHWYDRSAPVAVTEKVADASVKTVWLCACAVMLGGVGALPPPPQAPRKIVAVKAPQEDIQFDFNLCSRWSDDGSRTRADPARSDCLQSAAQKLGPRRTAVREFTER